MCSAYWITGYSLSLSECAIFNGLSTATMVTVQQQWLQYMARLVLRYDAAPIGNRIPMWSPAIRNVQENAS